MMPFNTSPVKHVLLEVERKFCGLAVPCLSVDAGSPAFRSLRDTGSQIIKDIYFDSHARLSNNGIWIRLRQKAGGVPTWEAKRRLGGSFNNSMFEELNDFDDIAACVQQVTGRLDATRNNFGLIMTADMTTRRTTWLADDRFKIVVDKMDFGHEVGEVELEHAVTLPKVHESATDIETWKRSVSRDLDQQIQTFMNRYHWAFRAGTPEGKLTAYHRKRHETSL